jgi:uncharacterized membrane protein
MTGLLDAVLITGFILVDGLLVAGAVALAVCFWRLLRGNRPRPPAGHQSRQIALDILTEKYERGDIDRAEFEGRRALLRRER